MSVEFAWRWGATAETRFLASGASSSPLEPVAPTATDTGAVEAQWPGFRGAARDGVVTSVRIVTDWTASPPEKIWRRPIGPGWSSFAVVGDRLYTQEQRGEDEVVACYNATNGEPVWLHSDRARFWETMAGPGPRATPTLHAGRVYAFGATGILNALDAADGSRLWMRDATADTGASTPDWGFASSPLIVDSLVVVFAGGPDGKAVVAYDIDTGEPRWFAPAGALSYSSAHLATIDGTPQIIVLTGDGATSLAPADGTVLWEHAWPMDGGARIVQPAITADGSVLIGTGFDIGVRRIAVSFDSGGWTTEERWTSKRLKPYYNDFVVHREHVYGFDGRILACLDLASGERKWKGGRYGNGQLVLLPDQDLLLVLSERGEVALVEADPAGFSELARMSAIAGKTWNHPVLVDDVLYVRNGEEMAALRLPIAE
jgi:outer membrane protein assembly factor BamB